MIWAVLLSIGLVVATICLHQSVFVLISAHVLERVKLLQLRLFLLVVGVFLAHMLSISLYAAAYYVCDEILNLGALKGPGVEGALGHYYASAVIYTSLGYGDILPAGHFRFIAGTEALNGLLLIAWSASFLFLAMREHWPHKYEK